MICCKINANFNNNSSFTNLITEFSKIGDVLWTSGNLYFADTSSTINEQKVKNKLKKCGYKDFFISVYDKDNQPQESDESINGWLINKLVKISYNMIEQISQQSFKEISIGLDLLNKEIDELSQNQDKQ